MHTRVHHAHAVHACMCANIVLCCLHAGGKLPVLQIAPGVQSSFGAQVEFLYGTTCLGHNFTEVGAAAATV